MKGVRCSWVDMQKIREALAAGKRGDQARLEMMRCVDQTTVSTWKAACEVLDAIEGKHDICHVSHFQPSHARILARAIRKTHGKAANWSETVKAEIADMVDRCEAEGLTVKQLAAVLRDRREEVPSLPPCEVKDLNVLIGRGRQFPCVYADPPWRYNNQGTRAATDNHYDTMTVDAICALPVASLAAEQAHLWLWVTNAFLADALNKVIPAWGFEFKSTYVWCKPQMGIGNYLRNAHELLLLATRGGLTGRATDVRSWGQFDRAEHSAKPEQIRKEVIERVTPPPRLELFARQYADGWTSWGDQINRRS